MAGRQCPFSGFFQEPLRLQSCRVNRDGGPKRRFSSAHTGTDAHPGRIEHQQIERTLWALYTVIVNLVCVLGGADLAGAINNVVTFGTVRRVEYCRARC